MKEERNRPYFNNGCFVCGNQGHNQWDAPKASRVRPGEGAHSQTHCQSHGQTPTQQPQSTSGPYQHARSKATGMAAASTTPRFSGYKTASKAVVRDTEPAAPEACTQNDAGAD